MCEPCKCPRCSCISVLLDPLLVFSFSVDHDQDLVWITQAYLHTLGKYSGLFSFYGPDLLFSPLPFRSSCVPEALKNAESPPMSPISVFDRWSLDFSRARLARGQLVRLSKLTGVMREILPIFSFSPSSLSLLRHLEHPKTGVCSPFDIIFYLFL